MPPVNSDNGPTIVVHPKALTEWANQAHDAAQDLAHSPRLAINAASTASALSCTFQSSNAATVACNAWSSVLTDLHTGLGGFGDKLLAAVKAYQKNDAQGADLFAPPSDPGTGRLR
jgi:hypothetical protein